MIGFHIPNVVLVPAIASPLVGVIVLSVALQMIHLLEGEGRTWRGRVSACWPVQSRHWP